MNVMKMSAGVLTLMLSSYAASASAADLSDIDVVSVVPRSPDVKPVVMAILTKRQQEQLMAASLRRTPLAFMPGQQHPAAKPSTSMPVRPQ